MLSQDQPGVREISEPVSRLAEEGSFEENIINRVDSGADPHDNGGDAVTTERDEEYGEVMDFLVVVSGMSVQAS